MNIIGLNCLVSKGRGKLLVIISTTQGEVYSHIFESPSIFSFKNNSGEILNWHRENILSLISCHNIDCIIIKKTEAMGISGKKSDVFKLYLEGVLLSLAGTLGLKNNHFYSSTIATMIGSDIGLSTDDLLTKFNKENKLGKILAIEAGEFKILTQAVLAFESKNL